MKQVQYRCTGKLPVGGQKGTLWSAPVGPQLNPYRYTITANRVPYPNHILVPGDNTDILEPVGFYFTAKNGEKAHADCRMGCFTLLVRQPFHTWRVLQAGVRRRADSVHFTSLTVSMPVP